MVGFLVIANSIGKRRISYPLNGAVANKAMSVSVGIVGGGSLLLAILYKYIMARRAFEMWNVRYGKGGGVSKSDTTSGVGSQPPTGAQPRSRSIYDRWLVVRFSIAFSALM